MLPLAHPRVSVGRAGCIDVAIELQRMGGFFETQIPKEGATARRRVPKPSERRAGLHLVHCPSTNPKGGQPHACWPLHPLVSVSAWVDPKDSVREKLPHDGEEEPCGRVKLHKAAVGFGLAAKAAPMHVDARCISEEAFAPLSMPTFEMIMMETVFRRGSLTRLP